MFRASGLFLQLRTPQRLCPHVRRRSTCVDCSGSQVCQHRRIRRQCGVCRGAAYCSHGCRRSTCIACKGSQICPHLRTRSRCGACKENPGVVLSAYPSSARYYGANEASAIEGPRPKCPHGRKASDCRACLGVSYCEHGRIRRTCSDCGGNGVCVHGKVVSHCRICGGVQFCTHDRQRSQCRKCRGTTLCPRTASGGKRVESAAARPCARTDVSSSPVSLVWAPRSVSTVAAPNVRCAEVVRCASTAEDATPACTVALGASLCNPWCGPNLSDRPNSVAQRFSVAGQPLGTLSKPKKAHDADSTKKTTLTWR